MKIKLFSAAALGALAAFALTVPASAQDGPAYGLTANVPGVCVINSAVLIQQSGAGKAMVTQLKSLADAVTTELKPEAQAIQNEENSLQLAVNAAATDAARKALDPRIQAFGKRRQALAEKEQLRNAELRATQNKALGTISVAASAAIRSVANGKACGVVIDSVADANPSMDITAASLAALNTRMPSVSLKREDLSAQAAAARAGQ